MSPDAVGGVIPDPHPVKPVLDGAAASGVDLLGILKVNVKVGNWSSDLARAC
jgi:hypothetical protein